MLNTKIAFTKFRQVFIQVLIFYRYDLQFDIQIGY